MSRFFIKSKIAYSIIGVSSFVHFIAVPRAQSGVKPVGVITRLLTKPEGPVKTRIWLCAWRGLNSRTPDKSSTAVRIPIMRPVHYWCSFDYIMPVSIDTCMIYKASHGLSNKRVSSIVVRRVPSLRGVATHWVALAAAPGPDQTCEGPQALMTNHMWGPAYFLPQGPLGPIAKPLPSIWPRVRGGGFKNNQVPISCVWRVLPKWQVCNRSHILQYRPVANCWRLCVAIQFFSSKRIGRKGVSEAHQSTHKHAPAWGYTRGRHVQIPATFVTIRTRCATFQKRECLGWTRKTDFERQVVKLRTSTQAINTP